VEAKRQAAERAEAERAPVSSELKRMQQAGKNLDRLPQGKIVLDAPKTMKVTEVGAVYANAGINVPDEVLRKHSSLPGGQSSEDSIRLSREMIATLTGPAFKIVATTPVQQNVAEGYPTVWSWNIEATEEGEQYLEATLYALLPSQERIASYRHTIGVTVKQQTWGEWVNSVLNKSTQEEFEALRAIAITVGGAMTVLVGWMGWAYSRRRREHGYASSTNAVRLFAPHADQTRATQSTTQRARKPKKVRAKSEV
jgi:hypothetical protein